MLRRFFFASVAGLIATAALPNVPDAAAADPSAFIDDLDTQLQHLIRDTSPDQRFVRFRQIFRADFDVPGIARFVLGPYWRLGNRSSWPSSRTTLFRPLAAACRNMLRAVTLPG